VGAGAYPRKREAEESPDFHRRRSRWDSGCRSGLATLALWPTAGQDVRRAPELASDLYRARGECQHPQPPPLSYVYRCPVAGGRLYFFVLTQALVEELKANLGEEFFQEIGGIQGYLRSFNRDLAQSLDIPGMVVRPNWAAMSDCA
jgi:hypothetical protein